MRLTSAKIPRCVPYELSAASEDQVEERAVDLFDLVILRQSPISSLCCVEQVYGYVPNAF